MTPTLTALGGGFRAEIQQIRRSRLLVVLTVLVVAANVDGAALRPAYSPLTVPSLPLFPVVGVLIAGLPVLLTPPLPEDRP